MKTIIYDKNKRTITFYISKNIYFFLKYYFLQIFEKRPSILKIVCHKFSFRFVLQ